jgi:hypothetical protein
MDTSTQHGYLVLADISGYTSYLAGVELDHAHEILTDLLDTVVRSFRSLLTIAKLEGDAVFAYTPETRVSRGETLLELVEATYVAFQDRIRSSHRHTTCQCRACQAMPTLDLKFFVHHGDYIVQNVSGIRDLVGSDVNLVHRLMKNHVTEATGWKAYALFTERGLDHLKVRPEAMHEQIETYEHLGDTRTLSLHLKPRYKELTEARRVVVTSEEAFFTLAYDYAAPPPVVWDWLNDPRKRALYTAQKGLEFRPIYSPGGRRGVGARTHCMHGKEAAMQETVLDWKPFDYFTVEQNSGAMFGTVIATYRLEPLGDGRHTRLTIQMKGRLGPDFLHRLLISLIYQKGFMPVIMKNMARCIAAQTSAETESPAAPLSAPA